MRFWNRRSPQKKDLTLEDKGSESLSEEVKKFEIKPRDPNPNEVGFDSLKRKLKQKVKKEKGLEYPTSRFESLIWKCDKRVKNTWKI